MENYILNTEDAIDIRKISKTNFIKIHQLLEDSGNKMFESTKSRTKDWHLYDYLYLKYSNGEVCMSVGKNSGKVIPYQDILDLIDNKEVQLKEPTYEIY